MGGHRNWTDIAHGCLESEGEEEDSRSTGKICWAEPKSTAMEISTSEMTVSMASIDLRCSCMKSQPLETAFSLQLTGRSQ